MATRVIAAPSPLMLQQCERLLKLLILRDVESVGIGDVQVIRLLVEGEVCEIRVQLMVDDK